MNVITLSDFHLVHSNPSGRLDNLPKDQFRKLVFVLSYAHRYKCAVLQAGDFSDVPRSWYLLPRLAEIFASFPDVKWYGIFGQHDTYLYSELTRDATTLGVLNKTGLVTILENSPTIVGNLRLYGCSFGMKIPKVKSKKKGFLDVLVIHENVSDKALFNRHKFKNATAFLKRHKRYDLILVGDIHRKFKVKKGRRRLINTGPIIRTKNTDYNRTHKPGFYVWNTESNKVKWITIPHEPAEDVFLDKTIEFSEVEQAKIITSIEEIKQSDQYKVDSQLARVLIDMYDEFSVTNEVQDFLADLLS